MKPADPVIEAVHERVMELNAAIEKARSEAHERCSQRSRPEERQRCWELHRMEIEPLLKEREVIVEKLARVAYWQEWKIEAPNMTRYVLEGEWTGYTSAQQRVVHREVIDTKRHGKQRVERLRNLTAIVYTDGTSLYLRLREAKPREKVKTIHSYCDLIRQAEMEGKSRVLVSELKH